MAVKTKKVAEETAEDLIHRKLVRMSDLSKQERDIELEKGEIKAEVIPLMMALGMKTMSDPIIGALNVVNGSNASINKEVLRANLLKYLDPESVAEVISASTKISSYTTLSFVKPKIKEA